MKQRKTTKKAGATSDLTPEALAKQEILKRQRFLIKRALLKRRRRKSHQ
jgi:hypothetical protein